MRTVHATLLSDQKSLGGDPAWSLVIGTPTNTIDVSAFVVAYNYEEQSAREAGLTVYLDNSGGEFSPTRSGSYAYLAQGAVVEFKRGRTVTDKTDYTKTDYLEELPRVWVENIDFDYYSGTACCIVQCIDWRGKLARHHLAAAQSWSSTSATTILEWILTQVSLTRLAGAMTATTLEFDIGVNTNLHSALRSLMRRLPEYLYPGIDAEIKWQDIDGADASDYTLGWNAQHPVLRTEAGSGAWAVNSVTVNGRGGHTGSASDATQITAVGTRQWTIYDPNLSTDAECAQRATAELDLFEAQATRMYVVCRPIHGLELFDVLTLDSPPWGGDNYVGRVISYREEWNLNGRWHQVIGVGATSLKDAGNQPARSKRSSGRRATRRPRPFNPPDELPPFDVPWHIPIGGIILWSGAVLTIPAGWNLCDGTNTTPDLRDRFVVGAGTTYAPDDTGGAASVDLAHVHAPGTLNTAADEHTHASGTLNTDNDAHTHAPGTLNTASDSHDHDVDSGATANDTHDHTLNALGTTASDSHDHAVDAGKTATDGVHLHAPGSLTTGAASTDDHQDIIDTTGPDTSERAHTHTVDSGTTANSPNHSHNFGTLETDEDSHDHAPGALDIENDTHSHAPGTLNTASDSHDHDVDTGVTASDSHDHDVDSGVTASDSHDHDVDTGETASALTATAILPPYYALCYIMRIA